MSAIYAQFCRVLDIKKVTMENMQSSAEEVCVTMATLWHETKCGPKFFTADV